MLRENHQLGLTELGMIFFENQAIFDSMLKKVPPPKSTACDLLILSQEENNLRYAAG